MKKVITILIISLIFTSLNAQIRTDISSIKIKKKKNLHYKTPQRNIYKKEYTYLLNGENYNGVIFEKYKNDTIKQEFSVKNGKLNGSYKKNYKNGNLEYSQVFINGEMDYTKGIGEYPLRFHESGKKEAIIELKFIDKEGNKFTTMFIYYENGQLREQISYKNSIYHGTHIIYDSNGKIKGLYNYKNGVYDGIVKRYDSYYGLKVEKWSNGRKISG